jgi:ornithine cyclodeaminase/alanine dehydrogenase-like protein (mu-crystallin family)
MNKPIGTVSAEQIANLGIPLEMYEAMEQAFGAVATGAAEIPPRQYVPLAASLGNGLVMPAYIRSSGDGAYPDIYAVKIFNDIPGNRSKGRARFQGVTILFDVDSGLPLASFDAAALTALRTGVSTAVATNFLSRSDASVLGLIGAGPQAISTLQALMPIHKINEVRVLDRHYGQIVQIFPNVTSCSSVEEVARGSEMIVMATNSESPLLDLDMVDPITHVSALGSYRPNMTELGKDLVLNSTIWVDNMACLQTSGDMIDSDSEPRLFGEFLADVQPPSGRTLYKSIGSAAQDAFAAWTCYQLLVT